LAGGAILRLYKNGAVIKAKDKEHIFSKATRWDDRRCHGISVDHRSDACDHFVVHHTPLVCSRGSAFSGRRDACQNGSEPLLLVAAFAERKLLLRCR
jgi:hypothetical protein